MHNFTVLLLKQLTTVLVPVCYIDIIILLISCSVPMAAVFLLQYLTLS